MNNSWKGWIIDKSLRDDNLLSEVKVINSHMEENTNGKNRQVWKLYCVEIDNADMNKFSQIIEKIIKPGYYAHFTDRHSLIIVFSGKSFKIRLDKIGKEEPNGISYFKANAEDIQIWQQALKYGTERAKVEPEYIIEVE